jgi:hypothetical protein
VPATLADIDSLKEAIGAIGAIGASQIMILNMVCSSLLLGLKPITNWLNH